jgi:3-oxoadipate CoA-transferase alpha subunit
VHPGCRIQTGGLIQETLVINKIYPTCEAALDGITDGCSVMISGFGEVGLPLGLVNALADTGCRNLTIISNNAGYGPTGISRLFQNNQVSKIICSYPRSGDESWFERRYREGTVELQLVPQGTLTESIRAGGAGIAGYYTRTGVGTRFATGKATLTLDGEVHLLERSITADFALIKGQCGDRWGNITYRKAARNYGPSMATAGRVTIVEVDEIAALGEQDPEVVVTPGIYVDRVVRNHVIGMVS